MREVNKSQNFLGGLAMTQPTQARRRFRLGPFEIDLQLGTVHGDGSTTNLQEQPLQILELLLERPGELVTREEIRRKLWPGGTFVAFEHSINTAVKKLRASLADDPEHPCFIETLPRRGYRLIAPLEVLTPAFIPAGPAGTIRERPLPIRSIAVLPLENLSHDPEQDYFADGMTEELITNLGKVSALRVISRTSVMRYKGTKKPLPEIARQLKVDVLVEGAVLCSRGRVRVTASLVHARTDRHLWAESYERELLDVLSLQGEVARAITREIQIKVTPQEQARMASARTVDPEAFGLYLQGRSQWRKRSTPQDIVKSREYSQQAIAKDPTFALAYAGLAETYWVGASGYGFDPVEVLPKAKEAAEKAVTLDATLAEGHTALATAHTTDFEWPQAEREYKRAIELNPSCTDAHYFYSFLYLAATGRINEAILEMKRALQLDPLSPIIRVNIGTLCYFARRYDEAIEQLQKARESDRDFAATPQRLQWVYEQKGAFLEAAEESKKGFSMAAAQGWGPRILETLREAYLKGGASGYWRASLKVHEEVPLLRRPVYFGSIYAMLGDKDKAFEFLDRGYRGRDYWLSFLMVDPRFDSLRSDPRYDGLLRRLNLPP